MLLNLLEGPNSGMAVHYQDCEIATMTVYYRGRNPTPRKRAKVTSKPACLNELTKLLSWQPNDAFVQQPFSFA